MSAYTSRLARGPSPFRTADGPLRLRRRLLRRGLLLLGCGETALRFCPALCVTKEQVAVALQILGDVLDELNPSGIPKRATHPAGGA